MKSETQLETRDVHFGKGVSVVERNVTKGNVFKDLFFGCKNDNLATVPPSELNATKASLHLFDVAREAVS